MFIIKHRQLQVAILLNLELKHEESVDPSAAMVYSHAELSSELIDE